MSYWGQVSLLNRVVKTNPENWPAYWVQGKAYQALEEHRKGLAAFSNAYMINPSDPDVAREASICAMECALHNLAIDYAQRAVELSPRDWGLHANLALAYLMAQQPGVAKAHIEEAYRRDSHDQVTETVRSLIDDVIEGRRACPRHVGELF